jgi:hypothetical protein
VEQLGYVSAMVEIEFYGEVGTGLGPTLEFYSTLALELQAVSLNMWRCPATVTRAELFPDGMACPIRAIINVSLRCQVLVRRRVSAASPMAGWMIPSLMNSCIRLAACSRCRCSQIQQHVVPLLRTSCSWASCSRGA